jgi:2Fe-2S ferredoxin
VIVVDGRDGTRHEFEPKVGHTLMPQLRPLKVGVIGLCNGNAACGTCHVYVAGGPADRIPPIDEYEEERLATLRRRSPSSRLSCQVTYEPELDGLHLTVAPKG